MKDKVDSEEEQPRPEEDESSEAEDTQKKMDEKTKKKKKKKVHKLSMEETKDFNAELRKRGVVYIARIPPRMGPAKMKSLLNEFGTVTRIYLEEEDKAHRKRRQKATGARNGGGKRYAEGWVEYSDKKLAKRIALALNNTPISTHKRSVHYGDLWNVKYLSKFQWSHLTEKVAYERRVREQKLRIEMMKARKENQAYSSLVEAGKTMDKIQEKRNKKRKAREEGAGVGGDDNGKGMDKSSSSSSRVKRRFKQNKTFDSKEDGSAKKAVLSSLV
eukprot:CAMPEP_0204634604 /NCGR_PEP_ID=MMETSP0717-20131115/29639_1 /ASSEMBLY_ACC=CAM_ASM_000666 /TAXON_ID=230516 /ORGANISM="Chaetoceros curvisetus" /LENGTH=272 /DNA_ID=CAMNT_0051653095 /DNA_START=17 /DNA_END=835 /DNA_ORIENTATION=-